MKMKLGRFVSGPAADKYPEASQKDSAMMESRLIGLLISFPRVTEMFQFTRFPLPALFCSGGSHTP